MLLSKLNKFHGYYLIVVGLNESGKTEEDRRCDAVTMYKETEKSEFKWIDVWDKLKGSPKWKALVADSAKDARRVSRVDEHNGAAADQVQLAVLASAQLVTVEPRVNLLPGVLLTPRLR